MSSLFLCLYLFLLYFCSYFFFLYAFLWSSAFSDAWLLQSDYQLLLFLLLLFYKKLSPIKTAFCPAGHLPGCKLRFLPRWAVYKKCSDEINLKNSQNILSKDCFGRFHHFCLALLFRCFPFFRYFPLFSAIFRYFPLFSISEIASGIIFIIF